MTSETPVPQRLRPPVWIFRLVGAVVLAALIGGAGYWWEARSTRTAMQACQAALDQQQWDDARHWADIWAGRRPYEASAWFARAEAARQQKDWVATEESLSRIPMGDRRYLRTQALRGDLILEELHDPHRAIRVWQDLLRIVPSSEIAHQRLIYLYAMTVQRRQMMHQIRAAIRTHAEPPEAYGYLLTANSLVFSDGFPRVSQWLRHQPEDETLRVAQAVFLARTNPSKGQRMFGVGDGLAVNLYAIEKCRADYPQNLEVLAYYIEVALGEAKFAQVGELLKDLPSSADEDSRFWRYRGAWLDSQRQTEAAAQAYQKAIELHPLDWHPHHELGAAARILKQPDVAARHADLGQRGKQLERAILELPNAAQVDEALMRSIWEYARDSGDADTVSGLSYRLKIR